MQIKSLFLAAFAASTAFAQAEVCGTKEPTEEQILIAQNFQLQEEAARIEGNVSIQATIAVKVYFHVLATSTSVSGGYLTVCLFRV